MTVTFQIDNLYTRIRGDFDTFTINNLCTFHHTHWFKRKANQLDVGAGVASYIGELITERKVKAYSYFSKTMNAFPTGILYKILDYMDRMHYQYNIDDRRDGPDVAVSITDVRGLRDYQAEALTELLHAERGFINHAPNSGKTHVAMELIYILDVPTLYLVPNKTLLTQTYNMLKETLPEDKIGIGGDGIWEPNKYTIAIINTLWQRRTNQEVIQFLNSVRLLILDECHHLSFQAKRYAKCPWNTWYQVAMMMPNAFYRFGLTASPDKDGTLSRGLLESATGPMLHKVTQSQLIEWGYSVKPYVKMIRYKFEDVPDIGKGKWQEAYNLLIYENPEFNNAVVKDIRKLVNKNMSVFVILTRVETQLKTLMELMPEAEFIWSKSTRVQRKESEDRFESGESKILVSTCHGEGANLPAMDALIRPCGNKSDKLNIQWTGRGVRKKEGKTKVLVIDYLFEGEKYTHNHSLERKKYYESEEQFDFEIVEELSV